MRGRLKRGEELAHAVRWLAGKKIELLATRRTRPSPSPTAATVHAQRKAIKHLRALLHLIRQPLGEKIYQEQKSELRRISRHLSPARDAFVQRQVVQKLMPALRQELPAPVAAQLLARVQRQTRTLCPPPESFRSTSLLRDDWRPKNLHRRDLQRALRHSWRRYCRQYKKARQEPDNSALHEWRKKTKDISLQLHFLKSVCPRPVRKLASRLDKLGKVLGDDHDLALVENNLGSVPPRRKAALLRVIEPLRAQKQSAALRLAKKLRRQHPWPLKF